jgi:tRNA-Thr(GGU) m(6)t(6)A37 methyltransferase TsaA
VDQCTLGCCIAGFSNFTFDRIFKKSEKYTQAERGRPLIHLRHPFHLELYPYLDHQFYPHSQEEAILLKEERLSERQGRTKAERQLRELQLELAQSRPLDATPNGGVDLCQMSFPLCPIGTLHSCFNKRNGTPRQPLLVPAARSALTLRPELAVDIFEGLQQYSHCWVMYIFHENTDLQRLWQPSYISIKSKIRVPRLNGDRLGVFATRSPHRPCPIGLSVAEIIKVKGSTLILGGADIVDGSPVLDIKPYIPFCDAVSGAIAPAWVAPTAEDEPLEISAVEISEVVDQMLQKCWEESKNTGVRGGEGKRQKRRRGCKNINFLYSNYEEYKTLVLQVLSRDIRSVTQRVKVPAREQKADASGALPALFSTAAGSIGSIQRETGKRGDDKEDEQGKWHVELDGVDVTYEVVLNQAGEKRVVVKSASLLLEDGG